MFMKGLPFASVSDKGVLLFSEITADTLLDAGSLPTQLVLFDSSSEYKSNTLTERRSASTLVAELWSSKDDELEDWWFTFGGSFSFNSVRPSFVSHFSSLHWILSSKEIRDFFFA